MKYRKKPVVIEAFQIVPDNQYEDWPLWAQEAYNKDFDQEGSLYLLAGVLMIATLEGPLTVSMNDWIIQGVKGEIYPCKPDIFAATYEPA